jgi:hypothetical protein
LAVADTHHHDHHDYTAPDFTPDVGSARGRALLLGLIGLAAWAVLGFVNMGSYKSGQTGGVRDFFLTYQAAFVFWMLLPIGGMTLLLIAYLTSASWGLVFRRPFQAFTRTLPYMLVIGLPVFASIGMGHESPFWWVNHVSKVEKDKDGDIVKYTGIEELAHSGLHVQHGSSFEHELATRQNNFLNPLFFLVISGAIFALYYVINGCLNSWGLKSEDEKDHAAWKRLRNLAGPGIVVWALTFTVFVTYYAMSIEPAWASTMFPVIAAMNMFLTCMCIGALTIYGFLGDKPEAMRIIKDKFRIDIGSLTFGFCMIWAYATFSQYMLIWAGNMPEEITYFKKRFEGGWIYLAYLLMAVHWLLPFVLFLFREVKTNPKSMKKMAMMLAFIVMCDVTWWIVPAYPHEQGLPLHVPMTVAAFMGVGGLWAFLYLGELKKRSLLPKKDTEFLATWGEHH